MISIWIQVVIFASAYVLSSVWIVKAYRDMDKKLPTIITLYVWCMGATVVYRFGQLIVAAISGR